jgi:hypothetical protein
VKSFTGMTHLPTADSLADAQEDEEYGYHLRPEAPPIKKGLNTFTWDLRYPGPALFKGMILWGASPIHGPLAPPGTYQVRFTAAGAVLTKSFEIRLDPKLKGVTTADVTEQFRLAMQIRDATNRANQAVITIRKLKTMITTGGHITRDRKELMDELSKIEENLYQVKNQSGQDPLNFPIKLNNRLAALGRSVETGDARPTAGSYQVFKELSAELDQQLAALNTLLQNKLLKNSLNNPVK